MADIKPTAQSLLNGITNDVKGRSLLETSEGSDLAGQFSEVMMSRMANLGISDKDMKAYLKKIHQRAAADQSVVDRTTNAQATRDTKAVKETSSAEKANTVDDGKLATKEKIETLIRELAQKNDAPVEDTKALKALKKVAEFLVNAAAEGKIDLPPEMTAKLQAFLGKNDAFSAYDMSVFMRDFIDAFRDMKIVMPQANGEASAELKWPQEIVAAFEALGLKAAAGSEDKSLTIVDVMRAVKALVNESEKAAHLTINKKLKDVVLPQDQMAALGIASGETAAELPVVDTNVSIDLKSENKTAEQASAVLLQTAVTQKDIETSLSVDNNDIAKKIAEENAAAAALLNPLANKPVAADKAKDQSKVWASELPASFVAMTETREAAKEKTPSLTNLAMNAAFPNRNAREADPKAAGSGNGSADSSQLRQSAVTNVAAAAPAPADLSAKVVDKGLDQLGANIAIGGLDNVSAASVKNAARATPAQATLQQPSAATQQVMAQISQKANKSTEISVQLTPAELGRVEVRLSIQRDGSVHAVVMADKPETLALLQKDASQLERSLQQAGLNANSENMSFNLRDQQQAQQFNQGRSRFSRNKITDDKVADIAMNVMPDTNIITDNRVNYHA